MKDEIVYRKAKVVDARTVQSLVNHFAALDFMLPRSLAHIYENIRDFTVMELEGEVVGCSALHPCWDTLAELRSIAVKETLKGKGLGVELARKSLAEATLLGIEQVFCLTFIPDFFAKLNFKRIEHSDLPQKIWQDCVSCIHFPDCKEVAMMLQLKAEGERL